MSETDPRPVEIRLIRSERRLALRFEDGTEASLPAEYLRVYSPSAELTGHGGGPRKWEPGKKGVEIVSLEPVGRYAVRPIFSDGHDTGIFTWSYLYALSRRFEENWRAYLEALDKEGLSREQR